MMVSKDIQESFKNGITYGSKTQKLLSLAIVMLNIVFQLKIEQEIISRFLKYKNIFWPGYAHF